MYRILSSLVAICILFLAGGTFVFGQNYYVYFSDKDQTVSPVDDFDQKALDRRQLEEVEFPAYSDFPVKTAYVHAVEKIADSLRFALRWFNAVTITASLDQVTAIEALPFVERVEPMEGYFSLTSAGSPDQQLKKPDSLAIDRLVKLQREMLNLDGLKAQNLDGKGVRIAIFDVGFAGADDHVAFQQLRENNQIIGTRDFYGKDNKVYHHGGHGTTVLSCLAGYYQGQNLGAATAAEYLLARTENGIWEKVREEDCWLAAMEWADEQGADIISSSLGYGKKRYTFEMLDGKTTIVTKAAEMASQKGILVVNSAGNSGTTDFVHVSAPGDGPSVLTVGSAFPMVKFPMPYTSQGPNYSRQLKPNVAGPGYVLGAERKGGFDFHSGTSFACPAVAGLAACLKQMHPEWKREQLHTTMEKLGHRAPYYDYLLGYGVPQMKRLWEEEEAVVDPTFDVTMRNDSIFVRFDSDAVGTDTSASNNGKPCFIHRKMKNGQLSSYSNYLIKPKQGLALPLATERKGQLSIWFEGYLWTEE